MAEQAATATATADKPGSASNGNPAESQDRNAALASKLSESAFDVESLMVEEEASEPGPTEEVEKIDAEKTDDEPQSEATEQEQEETPEPESEELTDEEVKAALRPKAAKRFQKVLDQVAAASKENAELKAQLEKREDEPVAVANTSDPLSTVTNTEQLEAELTRAKGIKAWCRRNPNGGLPPKELASGTDAEELSPEQVVDALEYAESIESEAPKRLKFLQDFQANRSKVREAIPEMFKVGTPEYEAAGKYKSKLLNFGAQSDSDEIIRKLVKLDRMEKEEREGVARYPRIDTKKTEQAPTKPAPKAAPLVRAHQPVVSASAQDPKKTAWDKANTSGQSVDVEELIGS